MIDYHSVPSPAFVLEMKLLKKNLELIQRVAKEAEVEIILALKGFAMWRVFPLVGEYLHGATASSLYEARLIFEEMGKKAHTYLVAYREDEFDDLLRMSSHLTFNSLGQYERYKDRVAAYPDSISCGIRVNHEYSEVEVDLYNPASPGSRLGEVETAFQEGLPAGIEGLHFHSLCESSSFELENTLKAFEEKFGHLLPRVKWVNMGGGHLMTRKDYDVEHLIGLLRAFREKHKVDIILEPGSAIAWETGDLVTTILDIHESRGVKTAIIDASYTAHMPDTLEMPYRPKIIGATDPSPDKPSYRIGGLSCLAGDYMEEYSFDYPLAVGDHLILKDMIHYTMVKTTFFNGVKHPSICILHEDGQIEEVRKFTYEDFKNRLS